MMSALDHSRGAQVLMNNLEHYATIFDGIRPFSGDVAKGYMVDCLGTLTSTDFLIDIDPTSMGGAYANPQFPSLGNGQNGEPWFECVNWVVAAREARERFVMITLGACYGAQAVGCIRALQLTNPIPYRIVAVEPIPEQYEWMMRFMRENDIDPDAQWLLQTAISDRNAPVLFPVGSPGSGAQNCFSTNEHGAREAYLHELLRSGRAEEALSKLLLENRTGIKTNLVPDHNLPAEIKLVSAVTLKDLLGPFDRVDYLESDIQQSEILVFPAFLDLLKRKVRRIHIGTHGSEVHWTLHKLFEESGWEIVFSYEPNAAHQSALGSFTTNDGILTMVNPDLSSSQ